ncbi:hypothetical protein BVG19_g1042 [[Candida] boidinii]|nr:hypothetical protein BVG19_g1042 [[Candida] boidinii]OWB50651.1 hypothetical protein B5S27_g2203 [[Candida] boidinii]
MSNENKYRDMEKQQQHQQQEKTVAGLELPIYDSSRDDNSKNLKSVSTFKKYRKLLVLSVFIIILFCNDIRLSNNINNINNNSATNNQNYGGFSKLIKESASNNDGNKDKDKDYKLYTDFFEDLSNKPDSKKPETPFPKLPFDGPTWNPESEHLITAKNGAVASDVEKCSQLGVEILKKGGFAADAAVTVALCIGTVNFFSSGIGGGSFITSKHFDEVDAITIDAREMAPGKSHKDMYDGHEIDSKIDGLSVGIPGELKGLYNLHKLHGSGILKWKDLVFPVANLAKTGWEVSELLALALGAQKDYILNHKDDWSFVIKDQVSGELLKQGDIISRKSYADTLVKIALNGSDAIFYDSNSEIVKNICEITQKRGGILEPVDFEQYRVVIEPALKLENFAKDGLTVYTSSGASSGLALITGLRLLDTFTKKDSLANGGGNNGDLDGDKEKFSDFSATSTHRLIETMKWMASVRSNLGDIEYSDDESLRKEHDERYNKFKAQEWIDRTIGKYNDNSTLPSWKDYEPAYQSNDPHGTSHFSVVDKHGNAVSMTTTVNLLFGSMVHDPKTGIVLNDEMDDFSVESTPNFFDLQPSIYNYIEPYKRPLSSCSPTIVFNTEKNKPELVIGAAGGSRITPAVLQAIIRVYHYNLSILETIAFPRIHHQLLPDIVDIENPQRGEIVDQLIAKGHKVEMTPQRTAMNGIKIDDEFVYAQSDYWRKLGRADGY